MEWSLLQMQARRKRWEWHDLQPIWNNDVRRILEHQFSSTSCEEWRRHETKGAISQPREILVGEPSTSRVNMTWCCLQTCKNRKRHEKNTKKRNPTYLLVWRTLHTVRRWKGEEEEEESKKKTEQKRGRKRRGPDRRGEKQFK